MKVIFLGTSSVFPTKKRNHQTMALTYGPEIILFDCGEGTQRQMRIAGMRISKISKIFITHWHGDHVLGLAGLLQSLAMNARKGPIDIWGPIGSKKRVSHLINTYEVEFPFKIRVHEVKNKRLQIIDEEPKYEILAAPLCHPCECIGYTFQEKPRIRVNTDYLKNFNLKSDPIISKLQEGKDIEWKGKKIKAEDATWVEKGKKLTYVMDTCENDRIIQLANKADLFICEATFLNELRDQAKERGHLTAKQAGALAKKANVKRLVITHFSQRYPKTDPLVREARSNFKNTIAAKDFMEVKV
ncbi:MAG: ribonuclease Z [Candidatus Woesearchaeota archaeon]|nr:MAG: ribonuclease Z [Candidatus Woesearchaeota archaeon]